MHITRDPTSISLAAKYYYEILQYDDLCQGLVWFLLNLDGINPMMFVSQYDVYIYYCIIVSKIKPNSTTIYSNVIKKIIQSPHVGPNN